eukprot:GHVT01027808.1.p2 GENE.GHVT01027808.1~~GHVT01027808.1.p2  ORF type:complete len:142 (-),score=31.51 GHVT01027808.1:478-903(-)
MQSPTRASEVDKSVTWRKGRASRLFRLLQTHAASRRSGRTEAPSAAQQEAKAATAPGGSSCSPRKTWKASSSTMSPSASYLGEEETDKRPAEGEDELEKKGTNRNGTRKIHTTANNRESRNSKNGKPIAQETFTKNEQDNY